MMSQVGSFPRAARSALEDGRSATGIFRSAILTYFGQIVIQERVATKGSCSWRCPERIAPEAQARSHGGPKHTECRPATQKHKGWSANPTPGGNDRSRRRKRHG